MHLLQNPRKQCKSEVLLMVTSDVLHITISHGHLHIIIINIDKMHGNQQRQYEKFKIVFEINCSHEVFQIPERTKLSKKTFNEVYLAAKSQNDRKCDNTTIRYKIITAIFASTMLYTRKPVARHVMRRLMWRMGVISREKRYTN